MIDPRKIIIGLATFAVSKYSVASSVLAGVVGAAIAPAMGFDPWTWVIGAVGGVVVRVKLPPTTRIDAVVNGIISVMLAGLGSPYIKDLVSFEKFPAPNIYFVAFMIAACWPWLMKLGWQIISKRSSSIGGSNERQ